MVGIGLLPFCSRIAVDVYIGYYCLLLISLLNTLRKYISVVTADYTLFVLFSKSISRFADSVHVMIP